MEDCICKNLCSSISKTRFRNTKTCVQCIRDLQHSEDPAKLGMPKKGQLKNMYAAYVEKYRIIYDIYRKEITIYFVYVGTHKDVYGTD